MPDEPKTKIMSYDEFRDYLKEHGQTVAMTTEAWVDIPKGTKIKFVHYLKSVGKELISSFGVDGVKDQFSYPFDIRWEEMWLTKYKGQFEVELHETPSELVLHQPWGGTMTIKGGSVEESNSRLSHFESEIPMTGTYTGNKEINKPKNKLMNNIVEFAKNLTLTEDERALRKTGLQDENGNWTVNAKEIAISLLTDGKKEELIQIAKAKLAEEKKCAK